ncbi:MAG: glycoside hydrolase 15-like protein [Candidatus Peribacteria bacterium]|nr:glycoside hydrolase 15-like protein [Candidatus Peribacteria bacterium]
MPRSLVLGNSRVLAAFDECLQLRDLYYPYVGMEDQTTYGHMHRIGVMVEGVGFSWINDGTWQIDIRYTPETLVGNSTLRNEHLGIEIKLLDYVHPVHDVLMRHFNIRTLHGEKRKVKLFFNHDFHIYGDKQKDTAFYEPYTNSVIHYRQNRYFLIGGQSSNTDECFIGKRGDKNSTILRSMEQLHSCGISSFTVGKSEYRGLEGTWRDAEDGILSQNPIEQGSVDSTISIDAVVEGDKETEVVLWLCLGKHLNEVLKLQQIVIEETPERLHRNCHNYWKSWVNKNKQDFGTLGADIVDLYKRSLLMIRTHIDSNGGIIAAADSDIMAFNRDTYTYVWPRDGAFVSMALDRAGYGEVTRTFFEFCARCQMPDGYMLHKYNPDGSPGSSWHPWYAHNEPQLPIQEDETALVIYAIWKHFMNVRDFEFLQKIWEGFVKNAAQFLCDFREEETGLPLASYDPWEEHRGIFTYTTASTVAGLHAAAQIAHLLGHHKHSEHYQQIADEMKQALCFHLFDEGTQRFVKKITRKDGKTTDVDTTPDASISVVWMLGVLPAHDPRIVSTMRQLEEHLTVRTSVGGMARYPNDNYQWCTPLSKEIPGNPWIITTLWYAQWHIDHALDVAELEPARAILQWVVKQATSSGVLPEQMHPLTGKHLSVSPLTWSHSTYVETVLKFAEKEAALLREIL